MHLNMFVSNSCFVYCKGCYSYSRTEKNKVVPTEKIIDFLKYVYEQGIKKVTFCGGDPLCREDIVNLLEQTKKIGFSVVLDTVGRNLLNDIKLTDNLTIKKIETKKVAELVDVIGIPIDGSTNEIFKSFRYSNYDILSEEIQICNELKKYNANICINTVAHKKNLLDAQNMARLLNSMPFIKKWQIFQYSPTGKYGNLFRNEFEISDYEYDFFKNEVSKEYHYDNVEFKSLEFRKNTYMLIDNSGNAWLQNMEVSNSYKERTIIGNILNHDDWKIICDYIIGK